MVVSLQYQIYLSSIYEIGRYPIGYTDREGYPTDRAPVDTPIADGGIQFESILILPVLSILQYHRSYRRGVYPNPNYPTNPILSSANWRRTLWIG